jgi:3-phenylpropionate/trans-cinnamate dioxygenase ferredoxin subunit
MREDCEQQFAAAARLDEVPAGSVKAVTLNGRSVLLCNSNARIFAIINRCSHADEKLECGKMKSGWIACPAHGARFDLATGQAKNPPAKQPIEVFAVRIVGDLIEVEIWKQKEELLF